LPPSRCGLGRVLEGTKESQHVSRLPFVAKYNIKEDVAVDKEGSHHHLEGYRANRTLTAGMWKGFREVGFHTMSEG
jgi:hypothetical protein